MATDAGWVMKDLRTSVMASWGEGKARPWHLQVLPIAVMALISVWMASRITSTGDWDGDSWPAVSALVHLDLGAYFASRPMMGPLPTLLQAPFAALGGEQLMSAYRWACVPSLLVAGLTGLYLASIARRRGAGLASQASIAVLALVNPLNLAALEGGHPEEILTAALAVAAVASASEDKGWRAAVLLGLALTSKQWAVIAILPTLMVLPRHRLRTGLVAAAIAAALTLPGLLAAPGGFAEVHESAARTGRAITPSSLWYPLATTKTEVVGREPTTFVAELQVAPPLVGDLSHPLIVLLTLGLPLAVAAYRGSFGISGSEAMALLALLALLRCALDSVNNIYYHVPLLVALVGWDALAARGLPLRSLLAAAVASVFWSWSQDLTDVAAYNYAYIAVVILAGTAIGLGLGRKKPGNGRNPEFSGDELQVSRIKESSERPINAL